MLEGESATTDESRGSVGSSRASGVGVRHPPYRPSMKVGLVPRILSSDGWVLVAQRGSHRPFKHPDKHGRVTVAGKASDDLAPGTLRSIMKQAQMQWRHG
jgi:predicted RNA binding protein YcfA (HicA-like mRNA interferase family)